MFKKAVLFLVLIASVFTLLFSNELETTLSIIQKLPEAKALMDKVHQEGEFGFEVNRQKLSDQFGAYWDFGNRVICVAPSSASQRGKMIGSIIFELHNAAISKEWNALYDRAERRQISREDYILAIEKYEYENSKKAALMVEKGIARGLFPESARLMTYKSFEEHYYYQQYGGHSAAIGEMYDTIGSR